jgi:hypothetical protein
MLYHRARGRRRRSVVRATFTVVTSLLVGKGTVRAQFPPAEVSPWTSGADSSLGTGATRYFAQESGGLGRTIVVQCFQNQPPTVTLSFISAPWTVGRSAARLNAREPVRDTIIYLFGPRTDTKLWFKRRLAHAGIWQLEDRWASLAGEEALGFIRQLTSGDHERVAVQVPGTVDIYTFPLRDAGRAIGEVLPHCAAPR